MNSLDAPAPPIPVWAFAAATPRPVRIMRRICVLWALIAFLTALWRALPAESGGSLRLFTPDALRALVFGLACIVCAWPLRHVAMHWARIALPVLYFVLLPSWKWFWFVPMVLILIPYLRYAFTPGIGAWFRSASAPEALANGVGAGS